jgi:hypothetical protein
LLGIAQTSLALLSLNRKIHIQLCAPKVVAMAVRMVIRMLRILPQVELLLKVPIVLNVFLRVNDSPPLEGGAWMIFLEFLGVPRLPRLSRLSRLSRISRIS